MNYKNYCFDFVFYKVEKYVTLISLIFYFRVADLEDRLLATNQVAVAINTPKLDFQASRKKNNHCKHEALLMFPLSSFKAEIYSWVVLRQGGYKH